MNYSGLVFKLYKCIQSSIKAFLLLNVKNVAKILDPFWKALNWVIFYQNRGVLIGKYKRDKGLSRELVPMAGLSGSLKTLVEIGAFRTRGTR